MWSVKSLLDASNRELCPFPNPRAPSSPRISRGSSALAEHWGSCTEHIGLSGAGGWGNPAPRNHPKSLGLLQARPGCAKVDQAPWMSHSGRGGPLNSAADPWVQAWEFTHNRQALCRPPQTPQTKPQDSLLDAKFWAALGLSLSPFKMGRKKPARDDFARRIYPGESGPSQARVLLSGYYAPGARLGFIGNPANGLVRSPTRWPTWWWKKETEIQVKWLIRAPGLTRPGSLPPTEEFEGNPAGARLRDHGAGLAPPLPPGGGGREGG